MVATSDDLYELLESQERKCALSGIQLHPESMELDHKLARSYGGGDSVENLHWLDNRIHKMKGVLSDQEFIVLCCRVADHSRRNEC